MGRSLRFTYAGALHHVTMRCNNKEFLFEPVSLQLFLDLLIEACERLGVRLHNYCLMTNHVHLLFTVPAEDVLPRFMHRVANRFAKRFNASRDRKGHLWEGRYRSCIVEAPAYFLRTMAYVDLNPVRARMVETPADYPWSGHRYLAAEDESLLRLHRVYLELGGGPRSRYRTYLRLLAEEAGRSAQSLAPLLFAGTRGFVWRMRRRFGLQEGRPPRVEQIPLQGGFYGAKPRRSRRSGEEN